MAGLVACSLVVACGSAFESGAAGTSGGSSGTATTTASTTSGSGGGATGSGGASAHGGGGGGDVTSTSPSCAGSGVAFGGHCYVVLRPIGGLTYESARTQCADLAPAASSYLVRVDSADEEAFLHTLLAPVGDAADAWIGLTCPAVAHAAVTDCVRTTETSVAQVAQNWVWEHESAPCCSYANWIPHGPLLARGAEPGRALRGARADAGRGLRVGGAPLRRRERARAAGAGWRHAADDRDLRGGVAKRAAGLVWARSRGRAARW
jgi:hypothetical protein